jgi:hypothetical protein
MTMNKYHNQHVTTSDGIVHDSRREADRWMQLKLLERAGQIKELQRQVKFVLIPAQYEPSTIGKRGGVKQGKLIERECSYIADFVYIDNETGKKVVEDTKGMRTKDYITKRKLMLYMFRIRIREV